MRYFFDYTTKDQSLLDYQGDEFLSPQGAVEFAETLGQLLSNKLANDWHGWTIEVRNADGKRLFSLQIGDQAERKTPALVDHLPAARAYSKVTVQ
jgi:hypothetical protein